MIGSTSTPSAPSGTEHADLGAALIPKDGELLRHLNPVSPSISSRRLLELLRARSLGRNGRPAQLVRGGAGMARGALSMVLAAKAAPAPEVEAAKDQALINARGAAVAAVAWALRSAVTALRVQA